MDNHRAGLERPDYYLQVTASSFISFLAFMTSNDSLDQLARVLESRKGGDPESSYTARLLHKGPDAFLK